MRGTNTAKNVGSNGPVRVFTTPEANSDLDEYIRSFGDDTKSAWQSMKALVTNAKFLGRSYDAVSQEIYAIRQNKGPGERRKDFEINREVADRITNDLIERGKFYFDR